MSVGSNDSAGGNVGNANPPDDTPGELPQWTVSVRPDERVSADESVAGEGDPATPEVPATVAEIKSRRARSTLNNNASVAMAQPQLPRIDEREVRKDRRRGGSGALGLMAMLFGALALLGLGALGYALFGRGEDSGTTTGAALSSEVPDSPSVAPVEDVKLLLQGVGYEGVDVEERDGTIFLTGTVESQADIAAVVTASTSQADGFPINTDGLTVAAESTVPTISVPSAPAAQADPLQRLQVSLNRTLAANPIIFEPGTSTVASWQTDTLDEVAALLLDNPGIAVSIVGYTDDSGPSEGNQAISEERAEAVRDYLAEQGIDPGIIKIEARGESEATGLRDIGYLERRVEFEVVAVSTTPPAALPLDVGIIVPSARDDLAFSQSLVDALNVLNEERGGLTLNITDGMFDVDAASELAAQYAKDGSDVVILHGAQFVSLIEPLAREYPDVVFVSGPGPLETDLPNVFVYTVAAEQGAYVLGDLAAKLSDSGSIGIVGPVPAPEPTRFVEGFRLGAERQGATVLSEFTGSFGDADAAAAVSQAQVEQGADILTGTAQMTVGPIKVAQDNGLAWFANQSNQSSLAPENVVASQVYHFEVAIREILAEIDANSTTGGSFPLTLGNGGMLLEFNPEYDLDSRLRRQADDLLFEVTAGSVDVTIEFGE